MPIDDVNNLAKYKAMIENATSLDALEDAYNMLTAAYQRGDMSYEAYMTVYDIYTAKYALPLSQWPKMSGKALSTTKAESPEAQRYLAEDPIAAWYRGKELPTVGGNPFQKWAGEQWAPAYSAYAGQEILNRQQGKTPGSFQSYLGEQGPAMAGTAALGALREAKGLTGPQQALWRGQLEGEDVGGTLSNLLRAAIEGKGYASPFARAAIKNVPGFERQWQTETLGGGLEGSETLLASLMRKLGLS